jgi:hypothetical protein
MFLAWETPPSSLLTSKAAGAEVGEKSDIDLSLAGSFTPVLTILGHTSTSIWWGAVSGVEIVCGIRGCVTVGQLVKPDPASQIIVGHLILSGGEMYQQSSIAERENNSKIVVESRAQSLHRAFSTCRRCLAARRLVLATSHADCGQV